MSDDLELLVRSLRERADCARSEGNMTATCDADYFARSADTIERLTAEVADWRVRFEELCKAVGDKDRGLLTRLDAAEAEAARLREGITASIERHGLKGKCACSDCNFLRSALRGEEG